MDVLYMLSEGAAEGPDTSLAWIFYIGLGVFLLMIVIGWVSSTMKPDQH